MLIIWLNLLLPLLGEILAATKTNRILRSYFLAQIGCTLSCWFAWQLWGVSSNPYRLVYSFSTFAVIFVSLMIVHEAGASVWILVLSALFSLPVGFWFYEGASRHDVDFWIVAVEGCLLAFLGAALALKCHLTHCPAHVVLAVLWLALAIYDGGWLLNPRSDAVNSLLPAYLVTVACLAIAVQPASRENAA